MPLTLTPEQLLWDADVLIISDENIALSDQHLTLPFEVNRPPLLFRQE